MKIQRPWGSGGEEGSKPIHQFHGRQLLTNQEAP